MKAVLSRLLKIAASKTAIASSHQCYDQVFRRFLPIFGDFCQFSAKKLAFFLKSSVLIQFLQNLFAGILQVRSFS
jgi:hypothetical protein